MAGNIARWALTRFGFRQTIRGAAILGLLCGVMLGVQGSVYAKAYPDAASRAALVQQLKSVPAVNFLSGEVRDAATPASYAIYKSLASLVLVTAIWGLMTSTRLLRGFEDKGQSEVLLAGTSSKLRTSAQLLTGYGLATVVSAAITWTLTAVFGAAKQVQLSPYHALLLTAAVYLPGLVFAGLGVLVSQLADTRGRAVTYGLVPLVALFALRGAANSIDSWHWLKYVSPFGWSDVLNPVLAPNAWWLLPPLAAAAVFAWAGLLAGARRDLGVGLWAREHTVRSRYDGLGSPTGMALRLGSWSYNWWILGAVLFSAFWVSLANVSARLLNSSSAFKSAVSRINGDFTLIFVGVGLLYITMMLLVFTTLQMRGVRGDEADGYLDNLLVQPVRRSRWLLGRLSLTVGVMVAALLLVSMAIELVAHRNGLHIDYGHLLQNLLSLLGVLLFTLGAGVLFYGVLPRLAVIVMAAIIVWSFMGDILQSLVSNQHAKDFFSNTSLFHYITLSLTKTPVWSDVGWLAVSGAVLGAAGVAAFTRRDITPE